MFNCIYCRDIEMMLMRHLFGIVVLIFLDIVTSVKAVGCYVPDTTWAADINQGIINVTSAVIVPSTNFH